MTPPMTRRSIPKPRPKRAAKSSVKAIAGPKLEPVVVKGRHGWRASGNAVSCYHATKRGAVREWYSMQPLVAQLAKGLNGLLDGLRKACKERGST